MRTGCRPHTRLVSGLTGDLPRVSAYTASQAYPNASSWPLATPENAERWSSLK